MCLGTYLPLLLGGGDWGQAADQVMSLKIVIFLKLKNSFEARHGGMFTDLFSLFSPQAPPFIVRFSNWHAQVDQGGAGPPAALANNQGWTLQDSGVTGLPLSHAFSLHLQACVTYQCWYHDHHHHNGNICTWFFCCWPYIVFGGKSNFRKSSILD